MKMRYFEDLREGEQLNCAPVPFSLEDIVDFAEKFDPQPFHVDEKAAGASIFKGIVASSLHTLSACTKSVVKAQGPVAILSGVGMDTVRMFNPVRPGDTLEIKAWWADLRRSKSKPDRGFAGICCEVFNQHGQPVVHYGYRYLLACKSKGAPAEK